MIISQEAKNDTIGLDNDNDHKPLVCIYMMACQYGGRFAHYTYLHNSEVLIYHAPMHMSIHDHSWMMVPHAQIESHVPYMKMKFPCTLAEQLELQLLVLLIIFEFSQDGD